MANKPFVQTVSSLVQGISRQAPGVRYPGQFEDAKNVTFNVVDGARKRLGTTIVTEQLAADEPFTTYSMHRIERDEEEEYLIVYGKGFFKIYDVLNGDWIVPTFADSDAENYLAYGSPDSSQLRFVTIADTTFIGNTKRAMRTLGTVGERIDPLRMPIKMQRVSFNPTTFEMSTAEWKERSYHHQIVKYEDDNFSGTGVFRLGYLGDSTSKEHRSSSGSGTTMTLPYNAESDEISKYFNGNGVDQDDATDKNESITGLSTIAYGKVIVTGGPINKKDIKITFSPDLDVTDLVTLHANTTGKTIKAYRGDDDTDPAPMIFTENMKVSGLAYHRNRLVMTADEVCVFSSTDDLFNFYQETPGTLVDSDPIVSQLAATDVCIIDSIIPFRNALILLTKAGQQFELGSGDVFSPSTAAVTPSTRYQTQSIQPVQIGDRLYMVGIAGSYSTLLEYFYDDTAVSNKAANITKHVDDLIPPVVIHVEAAPAQDSVLVMPTLEGDTTGAVIYSNGTGGGDWSSGNSWSGGNAPTPIDDAVIISNDVIDFDDYPSGAAESNLAGNAGIAGKLFVYRSYAVGQERKQSAWTVWEFGSDALMDLSCIDDELFILRRQYDEGSSRTNVILERLDMSESPAGIVGPAGEQWNPALDHRQGPYSGVHSGGRTTWTLTYSDLTADTAVLTTGAVVAVSAQGTGGTVRADGDHSLSPAYIGRKVSAELVLSTLYARDETGKPMLDGRTKNRKLVMNHKNAGDYVIEVASSLANCPTRTATHTPLNPLGVSEKGELISWTHGKNTELTISLKSDNPKPVTWISMENHGEIERNTTEGKK